MPIVDVELVHSAQASALPNAGALAAAIGRALGTPPGRTWVRLRTLDANFYAENESSVSPSDLPVFVTVLHAHPPAGPALAAEVQVLTQTIASCVGCPTKRVHVQYAPAGAGRQAFGGSLVE
jgi:phenylpyruvate tautomerase PptA (4-oxalocrotonate tautomerase family)